MVGRSKNLLRNPCAKEDLSYWDVTSSGGDGFLCEEVAVGCKTLTECGHEKEDLSYWDVTSSGGDGFLCEDEAVGCKTLTECGHEKDEPCWATSYEVCEKRQLVNLLESGISDEKLDNKHPPITVRDWFTARVDCGCYYKICVRLLADDKETELDFWEQTQTLQIGSDWKKVKHVFKDYPPGVRYVDFLHGGKDTKFWKGHYGTKMTKSGVFVGQKIKKKVLENTGKNLLTNSYAESGLYGWVVIANGGNGWIVEEEAEGCTPIMEGVENAEAPSCWATSHGECEKKQTINFEDLGLSVDLIDEDKPEIKVADWFTSRVDAGCCYWLTVRLLSSNGVELDRLEVKENKDAGADWTKVEESFTDYPDGVRLIEFIHGGKDNCFWAGHYGAKMTHASVMLDLKKYESSSSSSSSSPSS